MKIRVLLSSAILLLLATSAYPLSISFVVGSAKIDRAGKIVKANVGANLQDGDILSTGPKSMVVIQGDGSRIELKEDSKLLVDAKVIKSGSVSVIKGDLTAKFDKIKKDSPSQKIYTPTSVCAVRGTEFNVSVSDGGESRVDMSEGSLDVYNPAGNINISGSESTEVSVGEEPEKYESEQSAEEWKSAKSAELESEPKDKGEDFEEYINLLNDAAAGESDALAKLNQDISAAKSEDELKGEEIKIAEAEEKSADNYMLSKSANLSISGIVERFAKDKGEIYAVFEKVKAESNKVVEQQQRNMQEIAKVKEAYKKMRDQIKEKNKASIEEIKAKSKFKKE